MTNITVNLRDGKITVPRIGAMPHQICGEKTWMYKIYKGMETNIDYTLKELDLW